MFKSVSNKSPNTINSLSNDCLTTIKQTCNMSTLYTTHPKNIVKYVVCIIVTTIYQHDGSIFYKVGYGGILWIIKNTTNIICVHKLDTNINSDNKLSQNRIVCNTLNKNIIIVIMIEITKIYDAFDGNMNKINKVYQIAQQINNFDFIATAINVRDLIVYQMKKLTVEIYLFIISHGRIRQIVAYIFILPFKFNPSLYDNSLLLFHLIILKVDDFDLIVIVINASNKITVQIDQSYVILIMTFHELLMMVMAAFKLFLMVFYNNFLLNIDESWFLYTFLYEQWIIERILLIMIIIIFEFYVILEVLMYFNVEINNTKTFQSPSNDK